MKTALLVIDIQHWFFQTSVFSTPEGKRKVDQLVNGTNHLIDSFQERNLPIIHIVTIHKRDGSTRDLWAQRNDSWVLIEGSKDVEELPEIHTFETDIVVTKTRTNSFLRTDLEEILRKLDVDTVVIAGYSTNKCVGITAIEACERDFDVFLAEDAILGPQQEKVDAMLYILQFYGIEPMPGSVILEQMLSKRSSSTCGI